MKQRAGFTLIEIVLALAILLVVVLSLLTMVGRTLHVATTSDAEQAAIQLATDRTDLVRTDPQYSTLEATYAATETSLPSLPGYTRKTVVTRVTTASNDYKKVTVTVSGPGLTAPITRTVSVAAP